MVVRCGMTVDPRDELIADVQRWKEAAEGLRIRLVKSEEGVDRGLDWLARGRSLSDAINELVGSEILQAMEDALDEFKQCRYKVRRSLTNAALAVVLVRHLRPFAAEGMTVEQLIQAFGVTPKIAAGFAEEDRTQTGPGR